MSYRRFTPSVAALAATLGIILVVTLTPAGSGEPLKYSLGFTTDRRWLSDGILNLFLFLPLGFMWRWNGGSILKGLAFGVLLSTAVEFAQIWLPGRDPSLNDVVFNSIGTLTGLLVGSPRSVTAFLCRPTSGQRWMVATAIASVMLVSVFLLLPAAPDFVATRKGRDLLLDYPSRAARVGLDAPVYLWSNAFDDTTAFQMVGVHRQRGRWTVNVGAKRGAMGPTVGDAWALLGYPDDIERKWRIALSTLWVACCAMALGFISRGRSAGVSAVAFVTFLFVAPQALGVVGTPFTEWIGAATGFCFGLFCARLCESVLAPRSATHSRGATGPSNLSL